MYAYAANNPVRYIDPDGRQAVIPVPYYVPFTLPKIAPIPIPGEVLIPPLIPKNIIPYQDGVRFIEKPWDGDWHHAPNGPNLNDPNSNPLGGDWEPDHDANKKDPTGNKHYINKKTGERARWDVPTKKDPKAHWHRENLNRRGPDKYKKYLNPDGKPVKEDKEGAHIYPNPKLVPILIS